MSLINASNLTFAYDGNYDNIFENVSFTIDSDWKLGFIGRNGRGKTTFLKLLLGSLEYSGTISASVNFDYFPATVQDYNQNTIDVACSLCSGLEQWQLVRELSLLDIVEEVLYRPFKTLSSGEQIKVQLAALFLKQNNFLLIDEPTNHLDLGARRVVKRYLATKSGFILVSHDRALLDECVDHILSINRKDIEIVRGNFSIWWQNKSNRDNMEHEKDRMLRREIERFTETARRTASWSERLENDKYATRNSGLRPDRGYIGAKSAKMMKRAKVTENRALDAAKEKAKLLKNVEIQETLKISPLYYYSDPLVALRDLSIVYSGREICFNINFLALRGDRIALRGRNGSGKTSLLKIILGEDIEYSGTVAKASGIKISYVPQDTSYLSGTLSAYAESLGIDETQFITVLRKMDFSRVQLEKDMLNYSSGQKKKVLLAGSLCEQAHLYIWDEPLNFIDVFSRIQIEQVIKNYMPTIIFVEHDEMFCDNIATKTIEL